MRCNGKEGALRRLLYDKMSGRRTIFIALMWCLSIIELLGQQITPATWVNNLHQASARLYIGNLCMHRMRFYFSALAIVYAHFSWNF